MAMSGLQRVHDHVHPDMNVLFQDPGNHQKSDHHQRILNDFHQPSKRVMKHIPEEHAACDEKHQADEHGAAQKGHQIIQAVAYREYLSKKRHKMSPLVILTVRSPCREDIRKWEACTTFEPCR
jgi:hypothetical protein